MTRAREDFATNDGVRIHFVEWAPERAADLAIVFVPGGTGNAWSGEALGVAAGSGVFGGPRRVVAVSRRGTGL